MLETVSPQQWGRRFLEQRDSSPRSYRAASRSKIPDTVPDVAAAPVTGQLGSIPKDGLVVKPPPPSNRDQETRRGCS